LNRSGFRQKAGYFNFEMRRSAETPLRMKMSRESGEGFFMDKFFDNSKMNL